MKDVRITAVRKTEYRDLMAKYENPLEIECTIEKNEEFVSRDAKIPGGFCLTAWETLEPFVKTLAEGGGDFYDGWMKNPHSALVSCNDGFRPVSFLLEAIEED